VGPTRTAQTTSGNGASGGLIDPATGNVGVETFRAGRVVPPQAGVASVDASVEMPRGTPAWPRRVALVDAIRGAAIAAMVVFHLVWDLSFAGFIDGAAPLSPGFKAYSHLVASTFLIVVGVSLVLADRNASRGRIWRRIGVLAVASAGITLATWLAFPDSFIFFGILHCITLASIVALPLVRAPAWLVCILAGAVLTMPAVVASPLFDAPVFWWTGLGTHAPVTDDYRPFFPWVGVVLAGIVLARWAMARTDPARPWLIWSPKARAAGLLAFGGRHSLAIYLIHQPLLFGAVLLLAQATGTPSGAEGAYLRTCRAQCTSAGSAPESCGATCACLSGDLKRSGLWARALENQLSVTEKGALNGMVERCLARPASGTRPGSSS
jgi:uncharacterized membrane protein